MKAKTFLLLFCICKSAIVHAQVTTFETVFGYTNGQGLWQDGAFGLAELSDSTILALSFSNWLVTPHGNLVMTGFSLDGIELIEKAFGRDSTYFLSGQPGTMIKTIEGNFALAGVGHIDFVDTWSTFWIFNQNGDSIFEKDYGSLGEKDTVDYFNASVQLPDSGFALVGVKGLNPTIYPPPLGGADVFLVRVNKEGNVLWQKLFNRSFDDEGLHIAMFDSTHLIIGAYQSSYPTFYDTSWVFVTDLDGNIVKERLFKEAPYDCDPFIGPRLFTSIDGNFFMTHCLNGAIVNGAYEYPAYIAKMDTNLNYVWEHDFNTANFIYSYHAEQFEDSSILIIGSQEDSITGREWGWVAKLSGKGEAIWDKLYKHGNSFSNRLYDCDQTYDCGFVVAGTTIHQNSDQQSWLLKMDKYGCINPVCDTTASSCGIGFPTFNNESQSISTLELDASIYPNPASDVVQIFYSLPPSTSTSTAQLIVFDINGRKVLELKLLRATHLADIDVSSWVAGLYICEIKTANSLLTKKIIIGR
jgi:hypothetical protein